jgi:hypothetical protein
MRTRIRPSRTNAMHSQGDGSARLLTIDAATRRPRGKLLSYHLSRIDKKLVRILARIVVRLSRRRLEMPRTSHLLMAVWLVALPVGATAQSNNPTGNSGSNKSATASAGTADNKAASGMTTGDATSRIAPPPMSAGNSRTPGGTGDSIVKGDHSTIRGDRAATTDQKTGFTK